MLDEFWKIRFDDGPPLAHYFRSDHDYWVRFHSLPGSGYADTPSEWTTLLERHNTILGRLANVGTQLKLLTTMYSDTVHPVTPPPAVRKLGLSQDHWRTVAEHEIEPDTDPNFWHVFNSDVVWSNGSLDTVVRLINDCEISNVMIVDPSSDWLLHPYEGGMDVILNSEVERDALATEFSQWLSPRPDGL